MRRTLMSENALSHCVCYSCTMRNVTEPLRSNYVSVTERCGALRDVTERYGSVAEALRGDAEYYEHYGALRNVTEPLRKMSILPISN